MASPSDSHSRVSSEHDPTTPARLSALYQYHNAPEVAPAHGLEYDDTIYPVSDKFPVIHNRPFGNETRHYTGKHAFVNDNRPPRIIFGMKVKTFLVVATVMILVIVGAAVGGAVGGQNLHNGLAPMGGSYVAGTSSSPSSPKHTATATTSSPPTYAAATPTYTPIAGCSSAADNTTYTTPYTANDSPIQFSMHCNTSSPLTSATAHQFLATYVYSFADCADTCAAFNAQGVSGNSTCTFAAYKPAAPRPANCWVGFANNLNAGDLKTEEGVEVAILG